MIFRPLDEEVLVAGQIGPEDVAEAAAVGVRMIVNNRPDGEQPGQPRGDEIEAAAGAAGIEYRAIPISGGVDPGQIATMCAAMDDAGGPVLIYCRSGTRSTYLWALARARQGWEADEIVARAAAAGYDLRSIRNLLR